MQVVVLGKEVMHSPPVNLSTKPKHSFAQAAYSTPSGTPGLAAINSLASLVRAFPDLPPSEIVQLNNQATGHSSCNCKKKKMTTTVLKLVVQGM
jgi:hypothetical protein